MFLIALPPLLIGVLIGLVALLIVFPIGLLRELPLGRHRHRRVVHRLHTR